MISFAGNENIFTKVGREFHSLPKPKRIAIGIVSALAPVIVTACVAASSGDKKPIVAVTYYPTPTAALNTPIPTEVPLS